MIDMNRFKPDVIIDFNLPVYKELVEQIKRLKRESKTLRIKVNSHPVGGKSTFIKNNNNYYRNYKLLDFDNYSGIDRTSKTLLKFNNAILLGSYGIFDRIEVRESLEYDDIIYIWVIPPLKDLSRNILGRGSNKRWGNPSAIRRVRDNEVYDSIIKNNVLIKPLFYSFSEALDFCIDMYESNE